MKVNLPDDRRAPLAVPAPVIPGSRRAVPSPAPPDSRGADLGSRIRAVAAVQRVAGNGSTAAMLQPRRRTLQRVDEEADRQMAASADEGTSDVNEGANRPAELANARFSTNGRLRAIAAGGPALSTRDNGPAVKAVQQALLDLGYSLLRYHTDGRYGGETSGGISQFRIDQGLPEGSELDGETLLALDRAAPGPGVSLEHYVDYDRLFEDGKFDISYAIGYDDPEEIRPGTVRPGGHEKNISVAHDWLAAQGFTKVEDVAEGRPSELWSVRRSLTYPTRSGERLTREIAVNMRLILPGTGGAAAFGSALSDSELTIYGGHARRGIGPDFDSDKKAEENFVIGVNSALHAAGRAVAPSAVEQHHYVIDKVNDLEEMTRAGRFDPEKYRIWFFNACSSIAYMDELRGGILPKGMDRRNLDLFGTTKPPSYVVNLSKTSLAMVEGILEANTMEEITRRMERVGLEDMMKMGVAEATLRRDFSNAFFREGAGDNPVAPTP